MTVVANRRRHQQVDLAGDECCHHRRLLLAAQAAVNQPDAQVGEFGAEGRMRVERRLQIELVRFLDQRTDPVGLATTGDRSAHRGNDLLTAIG